MILKKTFLCGALGYGMLEILFRGKTHWSMLLAGGVSLCGIKKLSTLKTGLMRTAARCAALITTVEFTVGVLVNKIGKMNVWDYSDEKGNLLGQICPKFTALWYLLSLPIINFYRKHISN